MLINQNNTFGFIVDGKQDPKSMFERVKEDNSDSKKATSVLESGGICISNRYYLWIWL